MSADADQLGVLKGWIAKAEEDYLVARYLLGLSDHECPFGVVAYHCQQCAEKYLKAVLVHHGVDVPHVHSLRHLMEQVDVLGGPRFETRRVADLTRFLAEGRYPNDVEGMGRALAEEALATTEHVRDLVRAHLPPTALEKPTR